MATKEQKALWARNYRARKKAKEEALLQGTAFVDTTQVASSVVNTGPGPDVEVDVTEKPDVKPSLKERLFGSTAIPTTQVKANSRTKKGARGKQIDVNLLSSVLPVMIAGSLSLYARRLIQDPYKECAPSKEEVYSILKPLFNILGRRVEIVGSASEDLIDIIHCVICTFCTGIRIHITYLTIQEHKEKGQENARTSHVQHATRIDDRGGNPFTIDGNPFRSNTHTGTNVGRGEESVSAPRPFANSVSDDSNGYATSTNGDSSDAKREAELIASFFARDREGRSRLGLIR